MTAASSAEETQVVPAAPGGYDFGGESPGSRGSRIGRMRNSFGGRRYVVGMRAAGTSVAGESRPSRATRMGSSGGGVAQSKRCSSVMDRAWSQDGSWRHSEKCKTGMTSARQSASSMGSWSRRGVGSDATTSSPTTTSSNESWRDTAGTGPRRSAGTAGPRRSTGTGLEVFFFGSALAEEEEAFAFFRLPVAVPFIVAGG